MMIMVVVMTANIAKLIVAAIEKMAMILVKMIAKIMNRKMVIIVIIKMIMKMNTRNDGNINIGDCNNNCDDNR